MDAGDFKTSKGRYVSPPHIEKLLSVHAAVESCCVASWVPKRSKPSSTHFAS